MITLNDGAGLVFHWRQTYDFYELYTHDDGLKAKQTDDSLSCLRLQHRRNQRPCSESAVRQGDHQQSIRGSGRSSENFVAATSTEGDTDEDRTDDQTRLTSPGTRRITRRELR